MILRRVMGSCSAMRAICGSDQDTAIAPTPPRTTFGHVSSRCSSPRRVSGSAASMTAARLPVGRGRGDRNADEEEDQQEGERPTRKVDVLAEDIDHLQADPGPCSVETQGLRSGVRWDQA